MSKIIKSGYVIFQNNQDSKSTVGFTRSSNYISSPDFIVGEAYTEKERILNEALKEAEEIVKEAELQKEEMLMNVENEIEKSREKGFAAGYKTGYSEGFEEGTEKGMLSATEEINKKNEDLVSELCKQIYTVEENKELLIKSYEKNIVNLAVEISEKITKTKIARDDSIIKKIVEHAVKDYRNVEWVKIYLSADDYVTISTDKEIMQKLSQISDRVILEALSDSEIGHLIVETPEHLIDAGIKTQTDNLREIIKGI